MANASGIEARTNNSGELREPLAELLNSEAWKNLAPNYPYIDHLLPRDISGDQLEGLLDTFSDPGLRGVVKDEGHKPRVIEGLGTLSYIGAGEAKRGYLLTTNSGRKMAVLYYRGNTSYNGRAFIPDDPRIRVSEEYPDRDNPNGAPFHKAEYSDFRTYLSVPLNFGGKREGALILQEYGGEIYPNLRLTKKAEKDIKQRVIDYVTVLGYRTSEGEFANRHYLDGGQKDGPPYVIDIYTDDFHRSDLQRYLSDQKNFHHNSLYSNGDDREGILPAVRRKLGIKR